MMSSRVVYGNRALVIGALLALVPMGTAVHAQAVQPQVSPPTREELSPVPESARPTRPTLSIAGDIERAPCPLGDPKFAGIVVPVNSVVFNNLKGATAEEMRAAWAPYAGTRQPVSVLCEIRDAAATILRRKGYLAAVQVPTQRIENGDIHLEVLYARIVAVRARGETSGAEALIASYLGRLSQDEIFDRNRAERYMLLARDLPGYNVQLTLKPAGTGPGELIGEVTVLKRPYAVDFTVQNLASEAVGRWGGQLRAQFFGLTGMGDATSISLYSTSDFEEQQILQVSHEMRLGGEGLKLSGQFTYAWTEPALPGGSGAGLVTARTAFGTLEASYPLVRTQARSLYLSGGIDIVDQAVDARGTAFSRDRVRVLYAQLGGEMVDLRHPIPRWRVTGNVELRKGVEIFGATSCPGTPVCSRVDADPSAGLVRAQAVGEVAFAKRWSVMVAPRLQVAFDPVFSFEEFSAGTYTIGRGFDPGTLSGDSGVGTSIELRAPGFDLGKAREVNIRPFLFTDAAHVWNINTGIPNQIDYTARELVSVGGGVRAGLSDRLRLEATIAVPVEEPVIGGIVAPRDVRFLVSLTSRLLPWSHH